MSVLAGALALWSLAERPALLISGDGSLVGLMTPAGRALSKPRGAGFVAQSWLEDDGDLGDQPAAYARPGFSGRKGALQAALLGRPVFHFTGKAAASAARSVCKDGALVILSSNWPEPDPPDGCRIIDARALALSGALAIYAGKAGFTIVAARDIAGRRLWNTPARRKRPVKTADARGN